MRISKLAPVVFTVVTLLGGVQLRTASAAPTLFDACDDAAASYTQGYCDRGGDWDMAIVTYTCNGDGTLNHVDKVNCYVEQ